MKKTYQMEELDCPSCAAKMEKAIGKLDGVESVSIHFMTQKITVEAAEEAFDEIMKKAQKICKKIESDCRILVK